MIAFTFRPDSCRRSPRRHGGRRARRPPSVDAKVKQSTPIRSARGEPRVCGGDRRPPLLCTQSLPGAGSDPARCQCSVSRSAAGDHSLLLTRRRRAATLRRRTRAHAKMRRGPGSARRRSVWRQPTATPPSGPECLATAWSAGSCVRCSAHPTGPSHSRTSRVAALRGSRCMASLTALPSSRRATPARPYATVTRSTGSSRSRASRAKARRSSRSSARTRRRPQTGRRCIRRPSTAGRVVWSTSSNRSTAWSFTKR